MSRRVQVTREVLGDLIKRNREEQASLRAMEDLLLLLRDWYEPDLGKVMKNGVIIKDGMEVKDL